MNTFGRFFRLTTFGESHGPAMGGVLDGCPAGVRLDMELLESMLSRRRPGTAPGVSARREPDSPEFLSGLDPHGVTWGTPIGFLVRNRDARPQDYDSVSRLYRPNHADFTWESRFGRRDPRGGGRASARETVSWVVAGAVAASWLRDWGISAKAELVEIGGERATPQAIGRLTAKARREGDSIGGVVECRISGLEPGLGNPVFGKLDAALAGAMMGINAVKGVEIGDGFAAARSTGRGQADLFETAPDGAGIRTLSNHSGGVQGGISNGSDILLRVAFKPTPSIASPLPTVGPDGANGVLEVHGRHDPCVAIRGAVVVESMALLVVADFMAGRGCGI